MLYILKNGVVMRFLRGCISFNAIYANHATLGIDYDAITMEQFINLIEVLKLSKHLKTTVTHGKGKRKKR